MAKCECGHPPIEYAFGGMDTMCYDCEGDLDLSQMKCFTCKSKVFFNEEEGTWDCEYCLNNTIESKNHIIKAIFNNGIWHVSCNDIADFIAIKNRFAPNIKRESEKILSAQNNIFYSVSYNTDLYIDINMLAFLAHKYKQYELFAFFIDANNRNLEEIISKMALNLNLCLKVDYGNSAGFARVNLFFSKVEYELKPLNPVEEWLRITKS